ncbi:MAG: hypothetical protein KZQ83_15245 [gamma proteobacterium symbiont of Taylorina sp.]|nr:hypothetical protein [gamma proteobacterium symbiont of Taylorina sp.]
MLNANNSAEKSVNSLLYKQNKQHLIDKKWKIHLIKLIVITLVLISLAVMSVSDGQLIF